MIEDGGPLHLGTGEFIEILEPGGWRWEVRVDSEGGIIDFRVWHPRRISVDMDVLRHMPLRDLAAIARAYKNRADEHYEDGFSPEIALTMAELVPGQVRSLDAAPSDEEFAQAWQGVGSRLPDGTPRRDALAARFGVSVWTIDKWVHRVRKRGLIPPATTGKGNRKPLPKFSND